MTVKQGMYERDFHAWTIQQANLLKQGKFEQIDLAHIIEEIEALGRSEHKEIANRMILLIVHLLKWHFQYERSGTSWQRTIREQRKQIARSVADMPSLKNYFHDSEWLAKIWGYAVIDASDETDLKKSIFPSEPIWSVEAILDENFYPDPEQSE